jgi:hypothetical protein
VDALFHIWSKIQSGEYPWKDAKLQSREVTIERTAWKDEPDAEGKERSDPSSPLLGISVEEETTGE